MCEIRAFTVKIHKIPISSIIRGITANLPLFVELLPKSRVEKPDCRLYFYIRGWVLGDIIYYYARQKKNRP